MAPGNAIEQAKGEFQNKTDELDAKRGEVENKWNEAVRKVNSALDDVGWFTDNIWFLNDDVDRLRELTNECSKRLQELLNDIVKVVRGSVPVLSLFDAAVRWSNDIQQPVSSSSGIVSQPAVFSLRQWEGTAKDAYYINVLPMQGKAVDGITTTSTGVSKWLADVASKNLNFMLELITPVAELLNSIVAAAVAAASVAGLLEAIGKAADAIGKAVEKILLIIKDTAKKVGETMKMAVDALTIANDNGPFPGGRWPDSVRN